MQPFEFTVRTKKDLTDADVLAAADAKDKPAEKIRSRNGILVKGVDDVAVRFSRCCAPLPGDEIIGFITRGRGISIHRTDCLNILSLPDSEKNRLISAEWQSESLPASEKFLAEIRIVVNNRVGNLVDISKVFTEREIDIISLSSQKGKSGTATMNMSFEVQNAEELNSLIGKLRTIPDVLNIERSAG